MPESRSILGQVGATPLVVTDVYTVPANTEAVVSSILVCNQSVSNGTFSLSAAAGGGADDPEQYFYWNVPIISGDTFKTTLGITLGAGDVIRVLTTVNRTITHVFGVEIT